MENLILQIDGKAVWLPQDASITIQKNSSIWTDSSTLSYSFQLSISMNRHLFGSADEGHGNSIYDAVHGKRFRLYVMGIPFMSGQVKLDDEVSLGGDSVTVSLVSDNLDMDAIIGSLKARKLKQSRKIKVGECLGKAEMDLFIYRPVIYGGGTIGEVSVTIDEIPEQTAINTEGYSNVSEPYPQKMYCNTRVCWQHYDLAEDGTKTLSAGYDVLEANRQNSGLCFYMLYFLECVFSHFNMPILSNDCLEVDDLTRVAMLNLGYHFTREDISSTPTTDPRPFNLYADEVVWGTPTVKMFAYVNDNVPENDSHMSAHIEGKRLYGATAIASSKNFPDKGVKEILEAIENGFGIRFLYDSDRGTVRIVLLQKLLAQTVVAPLKCEVWEKEKIENNIKGFRLMYSAETIVEDEEERKEILDQKDRETEFSYDEYDRVKHAEFDTVRRIVDIGDSNTYIDDVTGNAYRTKENKEAKAEEELQPRLYEVGQYCHVDYGDCSDEDTIKTISIGFTPLVTNDVNYRESVSAGNQEEIPAYFLSEVGEALAVDHGLMGVKSNVFNNNWMKLSNIKLIDDLPEVKSIYAGVYYTRPVIYDSFSADSDPIASYDCGLTFGIMRGPGAKAGTSYFDPNYDGEGNEKWVQTPGNYAMTDDVCDHFGRIWDYNGDAAGIGGELKKRFSLKLKAEKPNPDGGYFPITDTNLQKRGIFDKFYALFAYWITHAKIMRFTVSMEIADFLCIDLARKYYIADYIGFIKSMTVTVTRNGMGSVTIDFLYL